MEIKPGLRVVRGPDWKWSDQDGGVGCVGTLAVVTRGQGEEGNAVVVQWDAGNRCNYRCGMDGKYDLRVYDNVQIGVKHPHVICDCCQTKTIVCGIRWKCVKCYDFDLCTLCYFAGKHSMDHEFDRIDRPDSPRKRVAPRVGAKKLTAKGLFSSAEVIRGHDWIWGEQDGGEGKSGRVHSIIEQDKDSLRSVAVVEWRETKSKQNYRVGYLGKVDLKCKELASGGYFYPEHLPVLGEKIKNDSKSTVSISLSAGNKVRVALDVDVFKMMQSGHGGWNDEMAETLGEVGSVVAVMDSGDVRVRYSNNHVWTMNPEVLTKADGFQQGDVVRISNDIAQVHTLQDEHGGWVDDMALSLGQVGRIIRVFPTGDVKVKVNGKTWTFNPQCMEPAPGETPAEGDDDTDDTDLDMHLKLLSILDDPAVVVAAAASGEVSALRDFLARHPDNVNTKAAGKTALHCAAVSGNVDMVKAILEYNPDVEIKDEDGDGPLHLSAYSDEDEIATLLINAGATVNARNNKDVTPLIIAAVKGHISVLRVLVGHPGISLSDQDSDGDTALHCAVLAQKNESVSILLDANADPTLLNFRLFTPIHEAARIGFLPAVEQFSRKFPQHINIMKDDGFSPLHLSALNDHLDTLTSLMENTSCNIDAVTLTLSTALHLAVDRGHSRIIERLVGFGSKLDSKDSDGDTPLHIALSKSKADSLSDETPQLKMVRDSLNIPEDHSSQLRVVVACFLVREGANIYVQNNKGHTPLQICPPDIAAQITVFVGKKSVSAKKFHNSLRAPPLPSSTAGIATAGGPNSLRIVSETQKTGKDLTVGSAPRNATAPVMTIPGSPKEQQAGMSATLTTEADASEEEKDICCLCDNEVNTKFEPCEHSVMCEDCAQRVKRCPVCKKTVKAVTALKVICRMCSSEEAIVTLRPCNHKFCPDCARRMRVCFECKLQIVDKEGLPPERIPEPTASITTSSFCPICLTEPKNTAFLCGHQLCWECSQKVDHCPVCRKFVSHRIRLFQ